MTRQQTASLTTAFTVSDIAIQIEGLSKLYRIGYPKARYGTLRESLTTNVSAPFRALRSRLTQNGNGHLTGNARPGSPDDIIWALKDVSFDVAHGEVVGIIGRNGAGKSTLLKILSRITEPTAGSADIYGRVGSLLEVGTGFHPELTGRENIFLNGSIIGMRRAEIRRKFDEIIDFAEIEKFIDTPVKHYSTGMYLRLAFAVAAHLEPEILLVDEVLAVGDAGFQRKCLGKIGDVAKEGRTVLFVSHNLPAVENLCTAAVLLSKGSVVIHGPVEKIIERYVAESETGAEIRLVDRRDRQGSGAIRFTHVSFRRADGEPIKVFLCGEDIQIVLAFENTQRRDLRNLRLSVGIDNHVGQRILLLDSFMSSAGFANVPADVKQSEIRVPRLPLVPGRYSFTLYAEVNGSTSDWIKNAGTFDVEPGDYFGTGNLSARRLGCFLADHEFQLRASSQQGR